MLEFTSDDRPHQRGARAIVDFNFGRRTDQARIAIKHHDAITFRTPGKLQGQSRSFW